MGNICPCCIKEQFSKMDKIYLKQNGQCWSCDREDWQKGELSTEEFERRERFANAAAEKEDKDGQNNPVL